MRWVLRIALVLVALVIVLGVGLLLLPADRIARIATDQFEVATGRQMTVEGPVRPTLWPTLGISTGPVTIANAEWSQQGPMLTAESLNVGVDPMALIRGDVRITGVDVQGPRVQLEIAADGRANWDMRAAAADVVAAATSDAGEGGPVASSTTLPAFSLDEARLSAGNLVYLDNRSGQRFELSEIDVNLRLPDFNGLAELDLSAVTQGQRLSVTGAVDGFSAFLGSGAVPVTLTAGIGDASLSFDGRAGLAPMAIGGQVSADFPDIATVFRAANMAAPNIPRGLGRSAKIDGEVTVTEDSRATLRNASVQLDQNIMRTAMDVALRGERPRITAQITAGALDLSGLTADEAAGGTESAAGWSRTPIDVSALQAADAEIALTADSIDLGDAQLGRTNLLTRLESGRMVTEIRELAAYGGQFAGNAVVNSRGGLSTRVDLKGTDVALQPLLTQFAGYDRLLTTGDVSVNMLGVGNDMHTLMNSLEGQGSVSFGKGELRGLDLVGMLRTLDTSYVGAGQKTIFDSISASFNVKNGVLRNDDLAFKAPLVTATGKGSVGIGAQTLDYRLFPVLLESAGGGLKVPLNITGTWANPRFQLDLDELVKQQYGDEIEELKGQAEDAVTKRINEELGTDLKTLDGVEDVLKKELKNRGAGGLLDLLGGKRP
ncbi:AsmA family protein [Pseudoruegeria sp. HB172150]|uniref:AsmA family protein n=1 Tax=Pseudoruegeria sp. HB172150 TaxID=2721164 RepID=UPI001555FCED|nr:AsmA family protein [Pseudoruegeria sp. HB172150]